MAFKCEKTHREVVFPVFFLLFSLFSLFLLWFFSTHFFFHFLLFEFAFFLLFSLLFCFCVLWILLICFLVFPFFASFSLFFKFVKSQNKRWSGEHKHRFSSVQERVTTCFVLLSRLRLRFPTQSRAQFSSQRQVRLKT